MRYFSILHITRDGFLALGYGYRGWRSASGELHRLHFRISAFFLAFSFSAGSYFYAVNVLHWPVPVVDFVAGLPALYLLLTAATWRQDARAVPQIQTSRPVREMFWAQGLPLILPLSVVALASRAPAQYVRVAWAAVTSSFLCYAARLLVMDRRQGAALSKLAVLEEKFSKAFKSSPAAITISRLADGKYIEVNDR